MGPAIKFALILIAVRTFTKTALAFLGESGFIISSMLASFAGIDPIAINLAEIAGKTISFETALLTLILAIGTNLSIKVAISFSKGSREFATKMAIATIAVIGASFIGLASQVLF